MEHVDGGSGPVRPSAAEEERAAPGAGGRRPRLLLVGPLPPPLDGTSVSFGLLCEEIARARPDVRVRVVDSAPKELKPEGSALKLDDGLRAVRVIARLGWHLWRTDRVVLFGSNGFLARMVPLVVRLARLSRTPCYVRPFGGSLAEFCESLPTQRRDRLLAALRESDGVIVQTRGLQGRLAEALGRDVAYLPGYRRVPATSPARAGGPEGDGALRLVFLGHVRVEKGVGVLLESLRALEAQGVRARCDFFGPIYGAGSGELERELRETRTARYRGVLAQRDLWATLAGYDALVLPSFYQGEGHPGVLIEAMASGLPIVATRFRSLPDLVEHGVNGLLVPPGDAESLAGALRTLARDRELRSNLAQASRARAKEFDVRSILPRFAQTIQLDRPDVDGVALESVRQEAPR